MGASRFRRSPSCSFTEGPRHRGAGGNNFRLAVSYVEGRRQLSEQRTFTAHVEDFILFKS
jgi:hypothetical protein